MIKRNNIKGQYSIFKTTYEKMKEIGNKLIVNKLLNQIMVKKDFLLKMIKIQLLIIKKELIKIRKIYWNF